MAGEEAKAEGSKQEGAKPQGQTNAPPPKNQLEFLESKYFKLFTLGLYVAGVSGLGVTVSFYLLFFWDSTMPNIPYNKVG